jgi:hypothetical protein
MKNDAIEDQKIEDVSAEADAGEESTTKPSPSERDSAMEHIAKQYREAQGYQEPDDEDDVEADELDSDSAVDDTEQEEPEEPTAQEDQLKELGYYRRSDGKLYTTMKVNGQEREVPADQVKAYLQKDLAGDSKLQAASDRERKLSEREQHLNELEQQLRKQSSHLPSEKGDEEIRQQAKAVLSKVWDGDDDAAAEALSEFIRQNTGQVNTDEILSEAERRANYAVEQREAEKAAREWDKSTRDGINWLRDNHPTVLEDENLREFVDARTARMVDAQRNGDPEFADMTPRQIIEKAAGEANDWLQKQGLGRESEDTRGSARDNRKKNLKPMPRGISKQPTQDKPQEPDNSPAAAISRMRQGRAVN